MIFDDENILRPINYYRLGSYWLFFRGRDHPTHKFRQNAQCKLGLSISQEISFRQSSENIDKLIIEIDN